MIPREKHLPQRRDPLDHALFRDAAATHQVKTVERAFYLDARYPQLNLAL